MAVVGTQPLNPQSTSCLLINARNAKMLIKSSYTINTVSWCLCCHTRIKWNTNSSCHGV